MTSVNIYLTFNGNCEEAFNFYKSVFGGEFSYFSRRGDMPLPEGIVSLTDEDKRRVMHIALPISNETMLMGDDMMEANERHITTGNNFSVSVSTGSIDEANRLFAALAAGGSVWEPMREMYWGDWFGMVADRFGINWMISARINKA